MLFVALYHSVSGIIHIAFSFHRNFIKSFNKISRRKAKRKNEKSALMLYCEIRDMLHTLHEMKSCITCVT